MAVTEVAEKSWSSRVSEAFKGIVFGFALVVAAVVLLFWNEGRTINRFKALKEGAQNVISVKADAVDPANEGKLIHIAGEATTNDVLRDVYFGFDLNAIRLSRRVEIYQWKEIEDVKTERTSGGGEKETRTYTYEKVWSDELIDSSNFKEGGHNNPTRVPVKSESFNAKNVSLGAFKLSESIIQAFDKELDYDPIYAAKKRAEEAAALKENASEKTPAPTTEPASAPETATEATPALTTEPAPEAVPASTSETAPEATPAPTSEPEPESAPAPEPETASESETESASALQPAETTEEKYEAQFLPDDYDEYDSDPVPTSNSASSVSNSSVSSEQNYFTNLPDGFKIDGSGFYKGNPNSPEIGDIRVSFTSIPNIINASVVSQQYNDTFVPYQTKTGPIELVQDGMASAEQMFANARHANAVMCWLLRLAGLLLMTIGFGMLFKPLSVIADFVPFLGSVTGFIVGIGAFFFSTFLSLLVIAIGWLSYRPLIGIPLVILSLAALIAPFFLKKKKAAKSEEPKIVLKK